MVLSRLLQQVDEQTLQEMIRRSVQNDVMMTKETGVEGAVTMNVAEATIELLVAIALHLLPGVMIVVERREAEILTVEMTDGMIDEKVLIALLQLMSTALEFQTDVVTKTLEV